MFRSRAGALIKVLWHDGIRLSLYAKRLDHGRFIWPATVDGMVSLTADRLTQPSTQPAATESRIGIEMF